MTVYQSLSYIPQLYFDVFWVCALRGQHELPRNPWSASRCSQRVPGMARASNRQRSRNWPPLGGCEALWSMPTNATGINILQTSTDYQNIQYEDVKDIKIQCKSTVTEASITNALSKTHFEAKLIWSLNCAPRIRCLGTQNIIHNQENTVDIGSNKVHRIVCGGLRAACKKSLLEMDHWEKCMIWNLTR